MHDKLPAREAKFEEAGPPTMKAMDGLATAARRAREKYLCINFWYYEHGVLYPGYPGYLCYMY